MLLFALTNLFHALSIVIYVKNSIHEMLMEQSSCFLGIPLTMILNLDAVLHIPGDKSGDFGLIATFHSFL